MVTAASTSQLITTTQNQTAVNWSSSRRDQKLWRKNNWRKTLQASQRWDFTWLWRCEGLSSNVEPQHDARRRLHVRVAPPSPLPSPAPIYPEAKRSLWSSASSAWLSAWYQWIISCTRRPLRSHRSSSAVTKCVFSSQANWIEGGAYSLLLLLDSSVLLGGVFLWEFSLYITALWQDTLLL